MSVLIIGCGYLGLRAAKVWLAAGRKVYALTRGRADELRAAGIEPIVGDVLNPESLQLPPTDTVLYAVGLDRRAGKPMREVYVGGLGNVLRKAGSPRPGSRFLYISSTSVYGQTDGGWVNESSSTEPLEESGKIVLEAEQTLRRYRPDAVILRFAGIYGPGRVLRQASLLKGEPVPGDGERYVNLIHVDDGVRAVLAAEANATLGETYLIADDAPPTRRELFTRTAELIGAPVPMFEGGGAVEANRRVSNAKAKGRLGFEPQYPSIVDGLRASVR
ncbi:MAG: SDR family oxidoreductase [Fimbriiglobus sp.]|nr:SDR family oxidoreductase [Fimbriiglobus sp.]